MVAVAGRSNPQASVSSTGNDAESRGQCAVARETNTDPDWEDQIQTMLESGSKLSEDFNALKLQQQQEELDFIKTKSELTKKRDEAVKQNKAFVEKMESVRVKLQLNNSKGMRKNFMTKIQEVTSEKKLAQEQRDKLQAELAEAEAQLMSLEQEQVEEQRQWDQELSELRSQIEQARKEEREAQSKAQRDERAAVEKERNEANVRFTTWIQQVGLYLAAVRDRRPLQYRQEKDLWEGIETRVSRDHAEVLASFTELLQQLERGRELCSLTPTRAPANLPLVPLPPAPALLPTPTPILPMPLPHHMPPPHHAMRLPFAPPRHALNPMPQLPRQYFPPPLLPHPPPRFVMNPPPVHTPPPRTQTPPTVTSAPAAAAPAVPSSIATAVETLSKLMDKMKAQFPQCSDVELKKLLQQVKTERGTLSRLSMDEVIEMVRVKVEANSATLPSAAAPAPQKPCLICQKAVEPGAKWEVNCSHTMHKECIQVWLESSKSNNCPFCPK
ncbi:unnamed protein product [Knipowitschia caucasica]